MFYAIEHIDEEDQHRDENQVTGNRQHQVVHINGTEVMVEQPKKDLISHQVRIIIRNPATHAHQANAHHAQGQYQEGWGHQPEMELAPKLVHTATRRFGEPVIDRGKEGKDESAKNRIMEVTHDEICVSQMEIY